MMASGRQDLVTLHQQNSQISRDNVTLRSILIRQIQSQESVQFQSPGNSTKGLFKPERDYMTVTCGFDNSLIKFSLKSLMAQLLPW